MALGLPLLRSGKFPPATKGRRKKSEGPSIFCCVRGYLRSSRIVVAASGRARGAAGFQALGGIDTILVDQEIRRWHCCGVLESAAARIGGVGIWSSLWREQGDVNLGALILRLPAGICIGRGMRG